MQIQERSSIKMVKVKNYVEVKEVPSYLNITKRCMLCLQEKFEAITCSDPDAVIQISFLNAIIQTSICLAVIDLHTEKP